MGLLELACLEPVQARPELLQAFAWLVNDGGSMWGVALGPLTTLNSHNIPQVFENLFACAPSWKV